MDTSTRLDQGDKGTDASPKSVQDRVVWISYVLVLVLSVAIWLIAVPSPLWLDETSSYWQISAGFAQIWSRQGIFFPVYSYILWLATKVLGTSEIALRAPSILAMLGAAYLLYETAQELFDFEGDVAIIAVVIFCLDPTVIFESIDARPYAFALLATNATILVLVRLRRNNSNCLAALFGFLSAFILYFDYVFGVILPALAICFFVTKRGERAVLWRQCGIGLGTFAVAFLPLIPDLEKLFRTGTSLSFAHPPVVMDLIQTVVPPFLMFSLIVTTFVALLVATRKERQHDRGSRFKGLSVVICLLLSLVPVLILYGVSVRTPLQVFFSRYLLEAVPGIALCWAIVVNLFSRRSIRLLFCVALSMMLAQVYFSSPRLWQHGYSWKYALVAAERNASPDDAPVLVCSDFIWSNDVPMPLHSAKESDLLTPLSYYHISVPVVPLPRALNEEAIQIASSFLQKASQKHERFLALAYKPSYGTLDWIARRVSGTYEVKELGVFEGIKVLEFMPRRETPTP